MTFFEDRMQGTKLIHPHLDLLSSREREIMVRVIRWKGTFHPHPGPLPSREREIKEVRYF
jgi:hypothetical protein